MALREVILTVLARRPMTGYDIAKNFDQVLSNFWQASHQQVYRELAALSADGCVTFDVVPKAGKPDKKVYELTKTGREELKRWVAEPTDPPRRRNDLLVKVMAGLLVDKPSLEREITRVTGEVEAVMKRFRRMRRECLPLPIETLPEYERALYLALRRGLLVVQAELTWLGEVSEFLERGRLKR
jgi:DNA-binding PadR family transcriptional regulator